MGKNISFAVEYVDTWCILWCIDNVSTVNAMKTECEIKKWGNSLAIRITSSMAEMPHFEVGTKVVVDSSEDGLVIKRSSKPKRKLKLPYSEKDLLKGLDSYSAHADELASLIGSEVCD